MITKIYVIWKMNKNFSEIFFFMIKNILRMSQKVDKK